MRERRRTYEMMFIVSPLRTSEEEITASINRVQQAITNLGGEVTQIDQTAPWGRRKFAYPIRDYAEGEASRRSFSEGFYVLLHFRLSSTRMLELERTLRLNDAVLRYLITTAEQKRTSATAPASASGATKLPGDAGVPLDDDIDESDLDADDEDEA